MMYFKITSGKYKGLIGTYKGVLGSRIVLTVQSRDQWAIALELPTSIKRIRRWSLLTCNGTNYVSEDV